MNIKIEFTRRELHNLIGRAKREAERYKADGAEHTARCFQNLSDAAHVLYWRAVAWDKTDGATGIINAD